MLCGYWFLTHCNLTKFHSLRESGYHVLFRSAIAGLGFFVLSHLAVQTVELVFPANRIFPAWRELIPIEYSVTLTFTVFFAVVSPVFFNYFYDEIDTAREVAEKNGDFIELLIKQSIDEDLLVELSLHSGKSYVGYAINSRLATQSKVDVELVPIASGYRKKETLELDITTDYSSVIEIFDDMDATDFRIAIPMSQIVSARLFDKEVYAHFQKVKSSANVST